MKEINRNETSKSYNLYNETFWTVYFLLVINFKDIAHDGNNSHNIFL